MTQASSVRSGSSSGAGSAASSVERMTRSAVTTAATPASLKTRLGALVGVVVVDGHVGGAGEQDADDGHVEVGRAATGCARPTRSPRPTPSSRRAVGDVRRGAEQLVVGEHLAAVVDGRRVGVVVGGGAQHVDEGARCRGRGRREAGGRVGRRGVGAVRAPRCPLCRARAPGGQVVQRSRPRRPAWTRPTRMTPTKTTTSTQGRDAEAGVADDQRPREEVDRVDGEHDVEEREGDVADLALRPADAHRVDARLVGAQALLGDGARGEQAAGDHRRGDQQDAGQHDRRCRCVTLHARQRSPRRRAGGGGSGLPGDVASGDVEESLEVSFESGCRAGHLRCTAARGPWWAPTPPEDRRRLAPVHGSSGGAHLDLPRPVPSGTRRCALRGRRPSSGWPSLPRHPERHGG